MPGMKRFRRNGREEPISLDDEMFRLLPEDGDPTLDRDDDWNRSRADAEDFGDGDASDKVIGVDLTQAELATLVGTTRQTVNANLRELEKAGIIGRRGRRLAVLQNDALRRIAETPNAS